MSLVFLLAPWLALNGQQPAVAGFEAPQGSHTLTPAEIVREFNAAPVTDYRLAEGDEIQVDVWARPELSGKHIIGPDGKITLPYVGVVESAGLTRTQLEDLALGKLQEYYEGLNVTVSVLQYKGNRVYVLGRVTQPGVLQFENQPTLLEAVARAGGIAGNGTGVDKPGLTRCVIFRGSDRVAWIDLKSLLHDGNTALNIRLQRDDTVYVPDGDDQMVYVLGEVNRPGAVRLTPDMSFMDALSQVGGPTKDASSKIRLVRHSSGIDREINFSQIVNKGNDPNVALQNGDIIYVPKSGLAKVGYILQQLSPATSYLLFASGVKNF